MPARGASTYEALFRILNRSRVRYLVVGGVAVVLHGVPRMTVDLDVMPDFESRNMRRLAKALGRAGLKPSIPEPAEAIADPANRLRWKREKGMVVLSFEDARDPLKVVDVFVVHPIPFRTAYARRQMIRLDTTSVPLAHPRDLIRMKRMAGRDRDLADIASLRMLMRGNSRRS